MGGNNSVMSQSAPGLLFDPSIIGNVQVVTPVAPVLTTQASSDSPKETSGTSTPTTSQPVGLTRSDSLAAVIADLNQTLAMTSVSNDMPPQFPTASTLFTSGGDSTEDAFDQL